MAIKETVEVEVKSNIGEVSKGASEAAGNISFMGVSLNSVKAGFVAVGRTAKTMFGSIKAGIMSTGIGALLIAVVGLVSYFTKTKRGADMLKRAMAGVGAVVNVIVDLFSKVGETMVNAFKNPQKAWDNLTNTLYKGVQFINKQIVNRFSGSWKVLTGNIQSGILKMRIAWNEWIGDSEEAEQLTEELEKVKEKVREGTAELKAANEAIAEVYTEVIEKIKEVTDEMKREAKAASALEGRLQRLRDMENSFMVQKAATRQEIERARLGAEDESKTAEERLENLKKALELEAQTTAQEIALARERVSVQRQQMALSQNMAEDEEKLAQLKVALIEKETASIKMRRRVVTEVNAFEKEIATAKAKAAKLDEEAAKYKLKRLENETNEELKIRIDAAKELEKIRLKAEADLAKLTETSAAKLLAIQQENSLAIIEDEKEKAFATLKIQEEKELASVENTEHAEELKAAIAEKYERKRGEITKKYSKKKKKWAEMSAEAQLDIMSSTAGNMIKILGEETEAGKAMAVTQATIDTYKGATAAYSSMAGIPYVGPILGAIAAGAAVASGLANVKAILSADSSGGVDDKTVKTTAKAPAPEMLSGKFELGGGQAPEPLKAFVVTDEMTNSQDQLANIRRRATV